MYSKFTKLPHPAFPLWIFLNIITFSLYYKSRPGNKPLVPRDSRSRSATSLRRVSSSSSSFSSLLFVPLLHFLSFLYVSFFFVLNILMRAWYMYYVIIMNYGIVQLIYYTGKRYSSCRCILCAWCKCIDDIDFALFPFILHTGSNSFCCPSLPNSPPTLHVCLLPVLRYDTVR